MAQKKRQAMQYSVNPWHKQLKFWLSRGGGHMIPYLKDRVKWHIYPVLRILPKYPDHLDLETTNSCNMKCPMCYRDSIWKKQFNFKDASMGFMKWELFTKIIDEAAELGVYSIRLSWRGEPMIHPKAVEMTQYAKQKGIKEVSMVTNAMNMDEAMSKRLIEAGVDWISNSFDGLGKVYESIRAPSKYDEAIERLKTMQRLKKEMGTKKPILKVQTVFSAIKDNPQAYYDVMTPIVDEVAVNDTQDHSLNNKDQNPNYFCPVPWRRMVISWNGKVVQCINDYNDRNYVGDLNHQSIMQIWHGEEFKEVRRLILKKERLKLKGCTECFDGDRRQVIKLTVGDREVVSGDLGFEFKNIDKAKEGLRLDETNIREDQTPEEQMGYS